MATQGVNFFREHFLTPAAATWSELQSGAQSSFTRIDLTSYLWNTAICSIPIAAGGATAYFTNTFLHDYLPSNRLFSILCTTAATIAGAMVSFLVVKILIAGHGTLAPFDAEKALKLETMHVIVISTATPIANCLEIPHLWLFNMIPIFVAPAVAGYFGTHSLYVMGFLSALTAAVNVAMQRGYPPELQRKAQDTIPTGLQ